LHASISLGRRARLQMLLVTVLALVLSGTAAIPFAAASRSGVLGDRAALLDLAMRLMPSPDLVRAFDGTQGMDRTNDGRLTFLLLGSDLRPHRPISSKDERTDMIMVLTINTTTKRMAAASIPRDMAGIPRPGEATWNGKINELLKHYLYREPSRAAALTKVKNVVAHLLGTPIDHVAFIRWASFDPLLDELGPIRVNIPSAIKDPKLIDSGNPVGVYFPAAQNWVLVGSPTSQYPRCSGWWWHSPGQTSLPGYECHRALMYARTRKGKNNSDFKRQKRGVDIVMAAITKAINNGSGGALTDLTNRADNQNDANFYSSLDMSIGNARALYDLLNGASLSSSRRIVFAPPTYATKVPNTSKYNINVTKVRTWIDTYFQNV
jgi:anionic cell wall polymer biosynthesis LytR-Cps2A-Psr (LCP) family protein